MLRAEEAVKLPDRETLQRFALLAENYRRAFERVQELAASRELGRVPNWVFAIGRMAIEDLEEVDQELATAEEYRRACRVALHAMSELMALETRVDASGDPDVDLLIDSLAPETDPPPGVSPITQGAQRRLDGFITVMNYARTASVIYVNGTFEPVRRPNHDDSDETGEITIVLKKNPQGE